MATGIRLGRPTVAISPTSTIATSMWSLMMVAAGPASSTHPAVSLQHKGTRSPVWSPDGRRILPFIFMVPIPILIFMRWIQIAAKPDPSHRQCVPTTMSPVWSPDGRRTSPSISDREGNFDIYVMDSGWRQPDPSHRHMRADDDVSGLVARRQPDRLRFLPRRQ